MRRFSPILLALLAACTTPIVRDTSAIDHKTAQCESVDCVIELMDTLPQGPQSDRYPFMDGVADTNLAALQRSGGLDVAVMNPALILLGFYGWAYIEPKKHGGVDYCTVRYLPGLNWLSLKHELSHCQGYADHGIPLQVADYTDEQKEIMWREGVKRWVDTSVYRSSQYAAQRRD